LIAAAWVRRKHAALPPFCLAGGPDLLHAAVEQAGLDCPIIPISAPREANFAFASGLPVIAGLDAVYRPGAPDAGGARFAKASLELATKFAGSGLAAGLVTAPVAKSELDRIGFDLPGQTEFLAGAFGLRPGDAVMMLAGPRLRTVPLTVHSALADVPDLITRELIKHKTRIVAAALTRDFGIAHPRMVVTGLNPHAGEGGKFGREEIEVIAPAVALLQSEGFDISGPHSADALFAPHARKEYDAALCMYHDQALIPFKTLEFEEGVNVTLGLPIIRTSPDHGTAFDIAGKGLANPGAMIAAIRMADECAARRAAHG